MFKVIDITPSLSTSKSAKEFEFSFILERGSTFVFGICCSNFPATLPKHLFYSSVTAAAFAVFFARRHIHLPLPLMQVMMRMFNICQILLESSKTVSNVAEKFFCWTFLLILVKIFIFTFCSHTYLCKNCYFLNFNFSLRPFLKILLLFPFPFRKAFCSSKDN